MAPPTEPGMHDKNSNPEIELSRAKLLKFLSNTDDPAINVSSFNKEIWLKDLPSFIITPSKPPSLIKVFEPAPITFILLSPFISFKKNVNSFRFSGLYITSAGPPKLNQECLERFSLKVILPEILFFISLI